MSEKTPSFEEALEELESIVQSMEEEDLDLEQLVGRFERGTRLQKHCQKILSRVEERIETLRQTGEREKADEVMEADSGNDSEEGDDELLF